jgi:hypothetical protein
MAGNKIDAATLVNRVTYQTDIAALRKVRKKMQDLKRQFNESDEKASKDAIKRVRMESAERIRAARREARELRRLGAGAGAGGNRGGNRGGSGGGGRSGGRTDADREAIRQRREQERQQAKQRREEEKRIRQQGTRNERADLMRRSRGFDITRMQGLNAEQRHNAVREAHRISEEYRNQTMSLQQANEALRQQRRQLESIARQQRNANRRAGTPTPRNRLAAGLAATGLAAGIGYGAERLTTAARETLAGSIERNAGRQQLQQYNISGIEADALIQQVRARTGKTLTYEQLADQSKDFQEKVGEASLGQWNQAKDGSWSLGSAGEMADLINAVTQRGGKAAGQQVQQNLQGMNFTDYLVYLRQLQKQFKFTDAQMTFFAETVNDGSLALGGLDSTGKNLDDTMMSIARTGSALTDEQSKNLTYLSSLGQVAQQASDNLGDSFSAAFAGRMKELGIGADETRQSFAELRPIMKELGETVGGITAWVSKHLGMIPGSASYNRDTYEKSYQAALEHKDDNPLAQWAAKRWNSTSTAGEAGWNDAMEGRQRDQNYIGGGGSGGGFNDLKMPDYMSNESMNNVYRPNPFNVQLPPINQNLTTDVHLHVDSDEFTRIFNGVADSRISSSWDSMTFDVNNMTFNN